MTFVSAATKSEHSVDLRALGIETAVIQLNDSSFDQFVDQLQPDIVLFDRFMIEEQFGWRVEAACPDAVRLLNTEDLHFLRKARQEAVQQKRPFLKNIPLQLCRHNQIVPTLHLKAVCGLLVP